MNIIVTGASRGIGFELVRKFCAEHKVIAISRNREKLKGLEKVCRKEHPGSGLITLAFDLENLEGIGQELFLSVREFFGQLDVLVNNAGYLVNRPVQDLQIDEARRMMTVNFLVPLVLVRTLMPLLRRGNPAHVVNIGSMAGIQGAKKFRGLSGYSASKAALHALTECLAEEFKDSNVRFNALALGSVRTEMLETAFPDLKKAMPPDEMASYIADFALKGHNYYNGKILQVASTTP